MSFIKSTCITLLSLSSVALAANSFPGGSVSIENRTLDEIYAVAKAESGPLTVVWGGDEDNQDIVTAAWKERFPDIELNFTIDLSKYHDSNIDRSFNKGAEYVDVAFLQTLHDFERWKSEGRLLKYKPAVWDSVYEALKDSDGAYTAGFILSFGAFLYPTAVLSNSSVPNSYADMILPEWKNKLVLTYPNDDDAIAYLFSLIIGKYGWDWMETLAHEQNVRWVRGTATPSAVLARGSASSGNNGTSVLSFTTSEASGLTRKTPTDDLYMSWAQTGAIFASTKRPESSKLFVSWVLSDEFQKDMVTKNGAQWLIRKDLEDIAPGGSIWEEKNTDPLGFWKFMVQREKVELWKLQYETLLGTAQGESPLHDDL